ncbi:RNA-binding protein, partial [Streptomyces sp. Vc714c-19]|nr:RNA-binding protein [Streptomyces sp. Vc714c-19]
MDFVERRPYDNRRLNKIRSRHRAAPKNKVYIGNLPWRVDNITLEQLFSIYGTVQKAEIACDRLNGRSLGYG